MKKIFALLSVALLAAGANAQTVEELEAKKATLENQLANYDDGIAKKWELRLDAGGAIGGHKRVSTAAEYKKIGFTDYDEGYMFDLGLGYNLTSNWYVGVITGYMPKLGEVRSCDEGNNLIPALADVTWRKQLGTSEKWSFFVQGRGGYLFGIHDDVTTKKGTTEVNGYTYFDINPGIYYRIKRNIDLKFSIGYGYMVAREGDAAPLLTANQNMFNARLGVNFRKAPEMLTRSELNYELDGVNEQLEALRLAQEEAARQAALKAAQEEAARKAAAEAAARKAAEEEAARLAALEAAKHKNLTLFYTIRESELNQDQNAKLAELAEWVKSRKVDQIVIKGYADKGTGNPRINVGYAKARAEKVKKALVKKYGIDKKMIECSSFGDTEQPFQENDMNRCAIILVNEID